MRDPQRVVCAGRTFAAVAVFLAAGLMVACSGGGDGSPTPSMTVAATEVPPQPTETPVATEPPGATGTVAPSSTAEPLEPPAPRLTGIEALDDAIRLIETGDESLVDLLVLQELPCSTGVGMEGPRPTCVGDEADGTPVEVFFFPQCDGRWLREAHLDIALTDLAAMAPLRYAAFEPTVDYLVDAAYVAVFEGPDPRLDGEFRRGAAVGIETDGRINGIWLACGAGDAGDSMIPEGQREFLLEPAAAPIMTATEYRTSELFEALPAEVSAAIVTVLEQE